MESSQTTTTNISENKEVSLIYYVFQGNYKGHGKYRGGSGYYNKYRGNRNQGFENEDGTEGRSFNKTKFYNKFPKKNYHGREMVDPYTSQMIIYRAEMYILTKYPALIDLNVRNDNITNFIDERSQFFIIKSFSEEDVHKSIKYNVWSSTKTGNQTLNSAFKLTKENGGNVYLFFSCNGSGRYIGLARMKNEVNETKQFMYWTQDSKWPGLFDVDWIFIKDVPFKNFKHICITMKYLFINF